jgi:hypothetical protein
MPEARIHPQLFTAGPRKMDNMAALMAQADLPLGGCGMTTGALSADHYRLSLDGLPILRQLARSGHRRQAVARRQRGTQRMQSNTLEANI